MHYRRLICLCIVLTALVQIAVAVPLDDERASSPSKKRPARRHTKSSLHSTRLRASSENDDEFEPKPPLHTSRRDYGIEDRHGSDADIHEPRNDDHEVGDSPTKLSVQQPQDALASGFFQGLGRFFGLSGDKFAAKPVRKRMKAASAEKVGALLDELEVEDDDAMKKPDEMHGKRAERDPSFSSSAHSSTAERWGDSSADDWLVPGKERPEDDDEPDGKRLDAAPSTPMPTPTPKAKDGKEREDYLPEADMRDIVHVFRQLFSSLEKSLNDKAVVGPSVRMPHGSKPLKRGGHETLSGFGDMNEDGQEAEDDVPFSRWAFRPTVRHPNAKEPKNELPDVRLALVAAESRNRQREAERKMKLAEEGLENDREKRAKGKAGGRAGVGERDEEEDMAADDERYEGGGGREDKEVPRSAPAWGARKRLLGSTETERRGQERDDHVRRIIERIADGFHSVF